MSVSRLSRRRLLALAASLSLLSAPAVHAQVVGDLRITSAAALPSIPGARNGGGFLGIVNSGPADEIVRASSPVCGHVELHTMTMENTIMRMREVGKIPVPAGQTLQMRPGSGYHLMLMDLKQSLDVGQTIPVEVTFAKAGTVKVELKVEPRDKIMRGQGMHGMQH